MRTFKSLVAPSLAGLLSLPLLFLLIYSLTSGSAYDIFSMQSLLDYTLDTSLLVLGVGITVFFIGGVSAFLVSKYRFLGSQFFSFALILPLAIPSYIIGYTYNGIFEFGGILERVTGQDLSFDVLNIYGCIAVFGISMYPYLFITAKVAFSSLSRSIDELCDLNGIHPVVAFFKVYTPLVYPAFFIGILLASFEVISDYGTVIYFGVETFSVGIFKQWFGYGDMEGAINIALAMVAFVLLFLYFESIVNKKREYASTTLSGQASKKRELYGLKAFFAFAFCFLVLFFSTLLPLGVLLYWAVLDISSADYALFELFSNTMVLNIASSFLVAFMAFLVLYFRRFFKSFLGEIFHKVSLLGYSIPGAVIAISLLLMFGKLDSVLGAYIFGGSFFILVFGYIVRFYPAAIGSLNSGFSKINKELDEASTLFGRNEKEKATKVYIPMLKGSAISAFLIVFIDISKELPLTLLLRPFNFDTLAVRIYELSSNEMLPSVGIPSLILVGMTAVAVFILNIIVIKR